ncbi:ABC transporter substrate-binding protein [Xanthobacter autotrophicus]|uniref:ABC transporter substrate-binding protein n=2 Tax=Xanthobacter autotrophicus TaxID=280 RepID=A0A6C1KCQ7_XANAU|nr:ABC transporter substrate-binding protein [Xanthobacter autotrophicus]
MTIRWPTLVLAAWVSSVGAALAAESGPVKIGVLTDMSSVYSDVSGRGSVEAARLAIEDAGEVLGQKVELVAADHQHKPEVGSTLARRWFDVDGVDMITDVPNSAVGFAVSGVAEQYKKPALLLGSLSTDLTGTRCSFYTAVWGIDTYSQAKVLGNALVQAGGDSWFFLGADYAFGRGLAHDAAKIVEAGGGKVLGSVFAPLGSADFSSFLLKAQQSGAKIIGFANAAADTTNALKQADEFGIREGGQKIATFVIFLQDVKGLGLKAAQGLLLATPYYWDLDEPSRAFAKRFAERMGRPPSWGQAGVYSAVAHYLKAVKVAGTKDGTQVMNKMRALPVNDFMTHEGRLRLDGRLEREMYLFEVKAPSQSKGEWDLYTLVKRVPGDQAFRPIAEGGCSLVAAPNASR